VEDLEILRQRLIERGHESEEQIELRLKNAQKEIRSAYQYDTILINKQGGIEASTQAFADYIEQFIQE
jgi:ribose 1,5-bisphosphokinase PhnN